MNKPLCGAILALLVHTGANAGACAFPITTQRFQTLLTSQQMSDAALLIGGRQGLYAERYFGSYTPTTVIAIASASKLLSGVRLVQLDGQGALDLDAPVSQVLPQFTGPKGTMTVRQMFAHTAGYGDDSFSQILLNNSITLAQAVDQIACCRPLNTGYTVGGQFSYGGVSMHIAGRVAEVVGGGDWQLRWQSQISAPLSITTIDWLAAGPTTNYGIAGTGRSNLRDYGRVLSMLVNDGRGNNRRVVAARSVRAFEQDQVGSLPVAYAPGNAPLPIRYGMGSWIDPGREPTRRPVIHSLGAFGFFPWIDFESQTFGVFMVRGGLNYNAAAVPVYRQMVNDIQQELLTNSCDLVERNDEIHVGDFEPA
jgi:CubicO group peptidase (beta-lactamase class C family)